MNPPRLVLAAFGFAALLGAAPAAAEDTSPQPPAAPASAATPPPTVDDARPPKAACVSQLDRAQRLQSTHKLQSARLAYLACSAPACPDLVREDCSRSLVELAAMIPTVVFSARADGRDVTDARVLLDGEPVSSALDGRAIALDPGSHVARFERTGGGVSEVRLVAREGEKNRPVGATFLNAAIPPAKVESGRSLALPLVLGGTGLLALGGSFYVRLRADAEADHLRDTCAPSCAQSSRDALGDKLVVANVALGVGVGALALAAATWLFDPRR